MAEQAAPDAMIAGVGVELLDFGDRCALFHEGRQELVELNETARHIWRGLAMGLAPSDISASLTGEGASDVEASAYVEDALQLWLGGGWVVPAAVLAFLEGAPTAARTLLVLDVGMSVEVFGAAPSAGLLDMLEPLQGTGPIRHRLSIAPCRDRYVLLVDGRSKGLYPAAELVPAVKAALTDRLAASVSDGFLAHGGLVARSSRRIFLSGGPGAGKSTLSVALAQAGFECLSDDIVHVDNRGWMKGAPFPPTLKAGSWPLLAGQIAGLEALPIHRRVDGRDVRYAPDVLAIGPARPLDIFVALDRQLDGPVKLSSLSKLEAMRTLLEGAFASAGRISATQVRGLAEAFTATDCYVLRYADLSAATDALRRLADE